MKKMRIVIILLIICIVIMFSIWFIFANQEKKKENEIYQEEFASDKPPEEYEPQKVFQKIQSDDVYFTVKKIVDTTVTYIKQSNGIIGMQTYTDKEVTEQGLKMLENILDKSYIKRYNITSQKLLGKVNKYTNYELKIDNMYLSEASNHIFYYLVYAQLDDMDFNMLIKTDTNNNTYSVFLQEYITDNSYSIEMAENQIEFDSTDIEKNDNNSFSYVRISDQYVADIYLQTYKNIMISNTEKAYELLNQEYKEKRFGSLNNFKQYLKNNKNEIVSIEIESYIKNTYKDYTEYVCKDQYSNLYIFKATAIMDYTVELDDYTLDYKDEEYLKEYKSSTDQYKVANNINKWVKMINNRDYTAAYNVLDKTFREREFGDVETFEKYMRRSFPLHYDVEYDEFTDESGIYSQTIILNDITGGEDGRKEKTIIMQLKEGTDFVMSFNITKGDVPME